ncbi:hypothetical protein [Ureibacillus aquaedulcis]|uniref:Uncharacterized protein n=1 Tax=Ureibacillus aquaedulcis TaxID=3058421 RepID=A0ABT8GNG4_9BACL|nr:hypothetical protein [Ureibacillus sp. BA0131]MDN4492476.1 hypothetical protein [Ureibacillus sp. BA0131]
MDNRYSILAKFREGHYFYLNFNNPKILDCLELVPPPQGLLALAEWPIYKHAEIEFFVELINGNIQYYHLKDRRTKVMKTIKFDQTELDNN